MKTEEQKIEEAGLKFMEKHSDRLRKWIDVNFEKRDEFAAENTYKFSNLLITISVGIIGGTSFLISNTENLSPVSKILSLSLVLPIILIILELKYRKKVIEINREAHDRRGKCIQKLMTEEGMRIFSIKPKSFKEFEEQVIEMDQITEKRFNEINQWIRTQEPPVSRLRKWSFRLLISSLISISLIILIESESIFFLFKTICDGMNIIKGYIT